jgi:hypothetical protein
MILLTIARVRLMTPASRFVGVPIPFAMIFGYYIFFKAGIPPVFVSNIIRKIINSIKNSRSDRTDVVFSTV